MQTRCKPGKHTDSCQSWRSNADPPLCLAPKPRPSRKRPTTPLGRRGEVYWFVRNTVEAEFTATGTCRPCDVCGEPDGWYIDHDHECCHQPNDWACGGCIRGVVCTGCNSYHLWSAEQGRPTPRSEQAAAYLERHRQGMGSGDEWRARFLARPLAPHRPHAVMSLT